MHPKAVEGIANSVDPDLSELSFPELRTFPVIIFFFIRRIVTGAGTLIMMTREFDPITETSLYPDKFGEG